ncbi:MAG: hypothetical protein KBD62_35580 [Kofleriaceae bacterium]|nr:hypothetical protein [Kofleriaceae bacterium]
MTARNRSHVRFASLFTAAAIAIMSLGMVMVQSAYDRAYADGAAAVAALDAGVPDGIATSPVAATAPVVHDPAAEPAAFGQDVLTAYKAGQWALVAVLVLIAVMVALTKVADRYSVAWLVKAKPYLGAASAVLVTQCGNLATGGHISLNTVLVVGGAVLLALIRVPGHGEAVKS